MRNKAIVTGAAGFIGSTLVDSLLSQDYEVVGIDNFATGKRTFLDNANLNLNFTLIETDLLREKNLAGYFYKASIIFHLAGNADLRHGPDNPGKDLEQNTIVTHKVLEASRIANIPRFVFSSTGSVYGDAKIVPTFEDSPFPIQTSLYGASKLACEGMIQAYTESFGIQSWIFRFVSILGPRYTHGHVFDFYKQLQDHPKELKVLGNGTQKKSYLHVSDCVRAILIAIEKSSAKINIFNLGLNEYCAVRDSVRWITDEMNLKPEVIYGKEDRGWIGDNPFIYLKTEKIMGLDWKPTFSIEESVRETVRFLDRNNWVFKESNKR